MTLHTAKPINLTLTPKAFAAWASKPKQAGPPAVALTAPAKLALDIQHLQVAAAPGGPMRLDPGRSQLAARLSLPHTELRDTKTHKQMAVDGGTLSIESANLQQVIKLIGELKVGLPKPTPSTATPPGTRPARQTAAAGTITTQTQVRHLIGPAGKLSVRNASIESHDEIKAVPSALLDTALGRSGQLAQLLGPTTSATADVRYTPGQPGHAKLAIHSDNVIGNIDAAVSPAKMLTLNQDAQFKLNVTPAVTESVLQRINPILGGVKAGAVPLNLTVARQGFAMPLTGFNWSKVNAQAHLQAGTLTLQPTGLAGIILGLLGQLQIVPSQNAYQVQLSPVNMRVDKGLLSYDKLQLGVDGAALDFKGHVNLATQKLDLTMSLSGPSVGRDLAGLSLPITGTISQPKIKTGDLLKAGLQQGAIEGLKKYGGKDVQKFLPGIEQLLGPRNSATQSTSQPSTQQQQQQQPKKVNPLDLLLQQLQPKKKNGQQKPQKK